jgi:cytochrome oxidase Cu insertion factor (SCO1/SenC/PrrC family)|tara:strand:- start:377 stop:637 length:261 start_codon:yes stop_codon:yes gene_type:complete
MEFEMTRLLVLALLLLLSACTDAGMGKIFSLGSEAHIECFSGGKKFLVTDSSGKVFSEKTSDGYYFTEKSSGDLIEVNGDCIIRYK